ncbi:universal stress protein [Parasporobacterium paucivorans]|uniref:Nucleotide-binding universal stress protein, UspA family n=1 Tax=Parasporobacterium paucivorans DSM 15970 TaxID=1122934 RepID=A0A1M6GMN0_9FIRM|nr:universal stress protein [Parasporobacterium paucivorans]SHJ11162.1 Nucleotide-binding universal stress protein, UspA family [Parasporobacterium paucivorans DSM 15970]
MFKKILVGTDGSQSSKAALTKAADIARASHCEIILLNVTLTSEAHWGYAPFGMIDDDKLREIGQKIIDETMEGIDFTDIELTKKVRLGSPELEILAESSDEDVDLIVMGSKGIGLFAGTMLGSVSERVLKTALCPVLIVKDANSLEKLRAHSVEEYEKHINKK